MSTPNSSTPSGGAAAPGEEIGDDMMSEVAQNLGRKLPVAAAAAKDDGNDGEETEEQKAERLANETPEEKAERERLEAEASAGGDGEETEEQKAERLANETPEQKAEREAQEAEAAEAAAKDPSKADKAEAAKIVNAKLKDADPEVRKLAQAAVDEFIDKVVVKQRAETDRLGSRVTELTTDLETEKKAKGPMIVGSVNPMFMAEDASHIDERESKIEEFERWAARYANGYNLPDSEGYDDKKPSWTAEQIEQRLTDVLHEKKKVLPAARANLQKRGEIDKVLRGIYPAIFDPKSAEYAQVQQVLKALPELKQFADYRVIALKQILGDRALADLLAKQKKESSPSGQPKPKGSATPPKKSPPRAPGGGAPAKGGVHDPKSKQTAAPQAVKKVMQDPKDKTAFRGAVAALISDI